MRQLAKVFRLELFDYSLLRFSPLPFELPPQFEWLFYYSPRGVHYFFEQLPVPIQGLKGISLAAMGPGTAAACRTRGYEPAFIGNGHPQTVAHQLISLIQGKRIVFIRAHDSRRSVERLLTDQSVRYSVPVYRNEIDDQVSPPAAKLVLLTSPLNASAYLAHRPLQTNQFVGAIGPSTTEALRARGVHWVQQAPEASEAGLAALLRIALDSEFSN